MWHLLLHLLLLSLVRLQDRGAPLIYTATNPSEVNLTMGWKTLSDLNEWLHILSLSHQQPQVIFKHSTRCSISSLAKSKVEKYLKEKDEFYLLDLLKYRPISNAIADNLNVTHQSPQVLVIRNGICVYHESHTGIDYDQISAAVDHHR